ncbi:MAG: hypothetical protein NTY19_31690 [Planctomycetota bacterium]|nr:hypothetical protein [Planctomycetota bacterium]
MTAELTPKNYLQLLGACVLGLRSLAPGRRTLQIVRSQKSESWLVKRSDTYDAPGLLAGCPAAHAPFELAKGGRLDLFLRLRTNDKGLAEIATYRLAVRQIPPNINNIVSLRLDKKEGQPRGDGWDPKLGDNPQHPWAHLHLNFDKSDRANELRIPTGEVEPIVLLMSFDHWYCNTFDV